MVVPILQMTEVERGFPGHRGSIHAALTSSGPEFRHRVNLSHRFAGHLASGSGDGMFQVRSAEPCSFLGHRPQELTDPVLTGPAYGW